METSQALPIESFSYRWLINLTTSFDASNGSFRASLEASDKAAFIAIDPKKSCGDTQVLNSPKTPVLVDEVFSDELLMPYYLTASKLEALDVSNCALTMHSSKCSRFVRTSNEMKPTVLVKVLRSWKEIIKKHMGFLRPSSPKVWKFSYSTRSYSTRNGKMDEYRRMVKSEGSSPRTSAGYSTSDWADSEKSIQEAVLHCKRSFSRS